MSLREKIAGGRETDLVVSCVDRRWRMGTFLQKLATGLHLGRLPARVRTQLESEGGILYLAEGIWETAILRHYRAPGAYCRHRRMGFIGYFALSERRLIAKARAYHEINVNVAYEEPRFKAMTFAVRPKYLAVAFDASAQSPEASGQIEIRLHLPEVDLAAQILARAGAHMESNAR
jgi:hypothetical protein